jgi:hypothetical protein
MAKRKEQTVTERAAEVGHVRDYGHGKLQRVGGNRTIYVQSNELWAQMVAFADAQGISASECISRAVQAFITNDKECPVCKRAREIYSVGVKPRKR